MKTDYKEKKAKLMNWLKKLTDKERIEITSKYGLHSIEGHQYSPSNQCLIVFQGGGEFTTLGGFNQWKKAGRVVKKGEHGVIIFVNCNKKDGDEVVENYFITKSIFDISQTEPIEN